MSGLPSKSLIQRLVARVGAQALYAALTEEQRERLPYEWQAWRRQAQAAPPGEWDTWLVMAGRSFGKSRTGTEYVREEVESGRVGRVGLAGRTAADTRDVMVLGESGIIAKSPPEWRPRYEPSKRRLAWPNGAIATLYAADKPDQLRGPQHDLFWSDEFASWRFQAETMANIEMGLRLGARPRHIITTTPRPTMKIRELVKGARNIGLPCQVCRAPEWKACTIHPQPIILTTGSTFDNAGNLVASFFDRLRRQYEGTRLGRQELNAEILDDIEGALWKFSQLEAHRRKLNEVPNLVRVVVAVDPAEGDENYSNENGVVVAGLGEDERGYVLADRSGRMSPNEWAKTAVRAYYEFEADAIVVEDNTDPEAVVMEIRLVDENCRIIRVHASRGKRARAEPVSALYEQGRISHVGLFGKLEDQMTNWTPVRTASSQSPDRVDALVWAIHELFDLAKSPFVFA